MNFKNLNQFRYVVVKLGVFFVLKSQEDDEITRSRKIKDIAQVICEDQDITDAYEEARINLEDIYDFVDELKEQITEYKFQENFQPAEEE